MKQALAVAAVAVTGVFGAGSAAWADDGTIYRFSAEVNVEAGGYTQQVTVNGGTYREGDRWEVGHYEQSDSGDLSNGTGGGGVGTECEAGTVAGTYCEVLDTVASLL